MVDAAAPHPARSRQLRGGAFTITATASGRPGWYEFSLQSGQRSLADLGGHVLGKFANSLKEIISNDKGRLLKSMPNAPFKELAGGDSALYVGNIPLSSYNTFFFFRDEADNVRAVLADSEGKPLAHTEFSADVFDGWLRELKSWA